MVEILGPKADEPAHVRMARVIRNIIWFAMPVPFLVFAVWVMRFVETGNIQSQGIGFLDEYAYVVLAGVLGLTVILVKLVRSVLLAPERIVAAYTAQYRQLAATTNLEGEALRYFVLSQVIMIKSIVVAAMLDSAVIIGLVLAFITADSGLALVSGSVAVVFAFVFKPDFETLVRDTLLILPADVTISPAGAS